MDEFFIEKSREHSYYGVCLRIVLTFPEQDDHLSEAMAVLMIPLYWTHVKKHKPRTESRQVDEQLLSSYHHQHDNRQ